MPIAAAAYRSRTGRSCARFDESLPNGIAVRYVAHGEKPAIRNLREKFAAALNRGQFWKSVPTRSVALFYMAIFSLFATLGFLDLLMRTVRLHGMHIVLGVLLSGGFAALFAVAALRRKYVFMLPIAVIMVAASLWVSRAYRNEEALVPKGSELGAQLQLLGMGGVVTLSLAYTFFLLFFSREGERYFRTHSEIVLARELHQALVPAVQQTIGDFEIYGASIPSGEVGGDLVDLVAHGDEWTAYVADVSGHGIAPGVLMAMFKASIRTRILADSDGAGLLEGVHQTLYPLKTSNMFVTAGLLHWDAGRMDLSLAGHPALVLYRCASRDICEYAPTDLPIGILPEQSFTSREIECQPGDILLLLTDGITEAANRAGDELGIEPIKSGLQQWAELPLPEIFGNLREQALRFGKQQDDQTMLLVRRLKG